MKRILAAFALALTLSSPAAALTTDYQEVSGVRYTETEGWRYLYRIAATDSAILVDVDIHLQGETPPAAVVDRWESGIESIWSTTRFDVPVLFDVSFVDAGWDFPVNVVNGSGLWNMLNWYADADGPHQERDAAHQFGHMLGLVDDGGSGLMGGGWETEDGYYSQFLNYDPNPVPEPSSFALMAAGLLLVAVRMKRREV